MDCSHVDVPEPIDGSLALAYSCNYFFMHMAERLSADVLANTFRAAGLASVTGLAPNEVPGIVRSPASRDALQLMAVGEDSLQVTPLGLAATYQKLALRVRRGEFALDPVVDGLIAAVRAGTAQLAQSEAMTVAGKTGTSPSSDRLRTHAWFAGFAPADRPEIAVLVFLEEGTGGSDAAPVAGKIFEAYR
jgi:cell division protein FtsI/penicillin-binding protein 2